MPHIPLKDIGLLVNKKFNFDQEKVSDWFGKYNQVRRKRKLKLLHEQGGKCDVCGVVMHGKGHHSPTIEHVIPVAKKGTDHFSNWTITCSKCNFVRGSSISYDIFKKDYKKYHEMYDQNKKRKTKGNNKKFDPLTNKRHLNILINLAIIFMYNPDIRNLIEDIK